MVQPFRITDQDDPGRDRGGWDESGNVDLPGTLTVDAVKGSGSSTPALTTITFQGKVVFQAEVTLPAAAALAAASLALTGSAASTTVLSAVVTGDTFDRFRLRADGRIDIGPGSGARDTNLYRSGAGLVATDGSFVAAAAGGGLRVKEGSNAMMGRSTLVAGTVVVGNTAVTANSEIFLTCQTPGGTPGFLRISDRTAGTSFTILSSSGTDTSVVSWLIVEPA
jgi:hypothetical protein